ncbi:MAG: hypothetical protein PVI03_01540 [Candidatus Thorarchaeota archaeon]|jgi:hypothetical protein
MSRLSREEMNDIWDEYSHLDEGEVARKNHYSAECSGDSNSMIIRRTSDGINAKCFRCNRSGKRTVHNLSTLKSKQANREQQPNRRTSTVAGRIEQRHSRLRKAIESGTGQVAQSYREFGVHGKVWLNRYGITPHEVKTYGICYDLEEDSLIFPTFDADGLAGFQERFMDPTYDGPKYLSYFLRPAVQLCAHPSADMAGLVLVEDFVSAIKVGRVMQAMPLRTTNMSTMQKRAVLDLNVREYYVWLDNDNSIVKRQQLALKNELDKLGTAYLIKTPNDPKCYNTNDIISIIYDVY